MPVNIPWFCDSDSNSVPEAESDSVPLPVSGSGNSPAVALGMILSNSTRPPKSSKALPSPGIVRQCVESTTG